MRSKPLVSVILPVFNSEAFVEATILSVLKQTYENLEVIIVDDCSTDSTFERVKKITKKDTRVAIYQLEKNSGGPATPRNFALDRSSGSYVAFIDSDDIWHQDKTEIQLQEMIKNGLDFSSVRVQRFSKLQDLKFEKPWHDKLELLSYKKLLRKNVAAASGVMFSRDKWPEVRFSTEARHVAIEDYLMWLQLHESCELHSARLPQRLVYYRDRDESLSGRKWVMVLKIWHLLGEIRLPEKPLFLWRVYYFLSYLFLSMRSNTYS